MSKEISKDKIMYISAFSYNSPENQKPFVNRPPMRAILWDTGKWDRRWAHIKEDGTVIKSKNYSRHSVTGYSRHSVRDFNTYEEADKHYKECVKRAIKDKDRLVNNIQEEIKLLKSY